MTLNDEWKTKEQTQQQASLWSGVERKCFYLLQQKNTVASLFQIHAFMLQNALITNVNLLTKFITTCASVALVASRPNQRAIIHHARRVFDHRPLKGDVFLCGAMIKAHLVANQFVEPFTLYRDLKRETGFNPDGYTFTSLAKCCTMNMAVKEGEEIHVSVVKTGFFSSLHVSTALVDMYVKFGIMGSARKLFDEMIDRSQVSWTALIVGYSRAGDMNEASKLFDCIPDKDTAAYNAMIDGYMKSGKVDLAWNIFDKMPKKNVISWTSMISGYFHNGDVECARALFDVMPEKNLFTWNAMIAGYCHNKQPHEALKFFHKMLSTASVEPNEVTITSILPAIADLGALDLGGWIHKFSQRKKLDKFGQVCTALIDMYAKCGEITKAKSLFDEMPEKLTVSWNTLINGLALNGRAKEALEVFAVMLQEGYKPNEITMIGVLSACNHCGLLDEGRRWFKGIKKFGLTPQIEHYGCMANLLGRMGCLDEAEKLIEHMPYNANGIIFSSILYACGYFKDITRAERVLKEAAKMEQGSGGDYVMLRNLYVMEQKWTDAEVAEHMMRKSKSYKEVGCSVIEVDGTIREFVAGSNLQSHIEVIHLTLGQLTNHMMELF